MTDRKIVLISTLLENKDMGAIRAWPKISVVIFTYNDPNGIKKALDSLKRQNYPKDRLEIVVIDNGSEDSSVDVARRYTHHLWVDPSRDGPAMRANGIRRATGEFVYIVYEQDMEMITADFLKRLVRPLLKEVQLVASFTREYPHPSQSWVVRFVTYDSIQRDPLIQFLTPSIDDTIVEDRGDYQLCYFGESNIPPVTHMLFRRAYLLNSGTWMQKRDYDHDTIVKLVEAGYHLFAYVPSAGVYHYHASNLRHFISKRIRNLNNHYFPLYGFTRYGYANGRASFVKIVLGVILANLLIPAAVRGLIRFIKYRDWVLLMDPLISIAVTDAVLLAFLRDRRGRRAILDIFNTIVRDDKR